MLIGDNMDNKKQSSKKTEKNLVDWFEILESIPCAAYVIKTDHDLSIITGNHHFYNLFGTSKDDMLHRYNNRLGALLDAGSSKALADVGKKWSILNKTAICLEQSAKINGNDVWIHTEVLGFAYNGETVLFCTSFDITSFEKTNIILDSSKKAFDVSSEQVRFDIFEYDIDTMAAYIHEANIVLPEDLIAEDNICEDFVKKIIKSGIILSEYTGRFIEIFSNAKNIDFKAVEEIKVKSKTGEEIWVRVILYSNKKNQDNKSTITVIFEEITQLKEAIANYLNEAQFYSAILSEKDAYAHVDVTADKIIRIGGMWNLYNEVIDKVTYTHVINEFIYKVVHPDDRAHYNELMQCSNFIESLNSGVDHLGCEFRRIVEQNKMNWMKLNVHVFKDPSSNHVFALLYIKNINDQKRQQLSMNNETQFGDYVNIYNKKFTVKYIDDYLKNVEEKELNGFLIVDIDDFNKIKESHGRQKAHDVIEVLADNISSIFRKTDIIGYFGSDIFVVLLKDISSEEWVNERLCLLLDSIKNEKDVCPFSCSIGISLSLGKASYERMFIQAEIALRSAKKAGKRKYVFFNENENIFAEQEKDEINTYSKNAASRAVFSIAERSDDCDENTFTFDEFVSEQGDMAYLVDPDTFDLIHGNKAFYDRIGMTEFQCIGAKCYELIHKRTTPCPFCSKANWTMDKYYIWKNLNLALEQEFLIKNKLVMWNGKEMMLALAVDISNDKSIIDSIQNEEMEEHYILSGVQHMADSENLNEVMICALECIGSFFRADSVFFWQRNDTDSRYECYHAWNKLNTNNIIQDVTQKVNVWLTGKELEHQIMFENMEAMLCSSYELYKCMKENGIHNQRWIKVKERENEIGYICINNISSNFRNNAFLESFVVFFASELKKRRLIEGATYADNHDNLTKLLSRHSFEEYLMLYNPDDTASVGVLCANINDLKGINNTRGFSTGNFYIQQFASMLKSIFRDNLVFRLNGDEFLVIAIDMPRAVLNDKVNEIVDMIDENGYFTVSIGQVWDDVENDLTVLIEQATQAMKINKKLHYDLGLDSMDSERRKMLNDIVQSIEKGEFEIFLQPKVELAHRSVIGAEALIRYRHKELGIIQPAQFVEVLEKTELIRYIDLFVFEEVCKQIEKWGNENKKIPVVSMNFSRITLQENDITESVARIFDKYDIAKKYMEIEITESAASMGKSTLYRTAKELFKAGFSISLDDFGTKYTNLSILADIDFSVLKLDKSLVAELVKQQNHQHIVRNIINMCNDLGINVIAEGVETLAQEWVLKNLGCNLAQGYFYGKPMPIDEFEKKYM